MTDIVTQYLRPVIYAYKGVPGDILLTLCPDGNRKEMEETARLYRLGTKKNEAGIALTLSGEVEMITKVRNVRFYWQAQQAETTFVNGLSAVWKPAQLKQLGKTPEQIADAMRDYLRVRLRVSGKRLHVITAEALKIEADVETAKKLLEESNMTPVDILITGLGYKVDEKIRNLMITRLLSWFYGYDGRPIYTAEFTPPETGKTFFGIKSEVIVRWEYFSELPSPARFIADARTGALGTVFTAEGAIFDEFDKWPQTKERAFSLLSSLCTGMEQGRWVRGVSLENGQVPTIERFIGIHLSGNIGDLAIPGQVKSNGEDVDIAANNRLNFVSTYKPLLGADVAPLADRFAVIDIRFETPKIEEYVTFKILPTPIMRGLVTILREQFYDNYGDVSALRGRLRRHANNVYAALKTLGLEVDPVRVDAIVLGQRNYDYVEA